MIGDERGNVCISPSQAINLLSLCDLVRAGDLAIFGDAAADVDAAKSLLADIAQEIALQVHDGQD